MSDAVKKDRRETRLARALPRYLRTRRSRTPGIQSRISGYQDYLAHTAH